jgi:hypothetical protein
MRCLNAWLGVKTQPDGASVNTAQKHAHFLTLLRRA